MTAPRIEYDIAIRCPRCQRTLYERHGFGSEEYTREMQVAREERDRYADGHPGHQVQLNANTKAV